VGILRGSLVRRRPAAVRAGAELIALGLILGLTAGACSGSGSAPLSVRDRRWQQDVSYLARALPVYREAGLGAVSRSAWDAAAARLEAQVPQLTDGQVVVRLAQMVAMLHDDETLVLFPRGPVFLLDAQLVGGGLYLLAVPAADRAVLGARVLAVDGHPVAQVLARAGSVIDAEDPQLRSNSETGVLDDGALLHWLGITTSESAAVLTVTTAAGHHETVRIASAAGVSAFIDTPLLFTFHLPGEAYVPLPLYQQDAAQPYWMRILPAQHAVYLKYNQCVEGSGFQQLAAQALAQLATHPDYRLIVDLRNNFGGDSGPFQSLIAAIQANPGLRARGRVIGLVNQFTDSSATVDAHSLQQAGVLLIGQPPADPVDEWGGEQTLQLPWYGIVIQYTSAAVNSDTTPMGIPNIVVEPTLAQILAGDDPVLAAALAYRPAG
jgi:hypothetical protein